MRHRYLVTNNVLYRNNIQTNQITDSVKQSNGHHYKGKCSILIEIQIALIFSHNDKELHIERNFD